MAHKSVWPLDLGKSTCLQFVIEGKFWILNLNIKSYARQCMYHISFTIIMSLQTFGICIKHSHHLGSCFHNMWSMVNFIQTTLCFPDYFVTHIALGIFLVVSFHRIAKSNWPYYPEHFHVNWYQIGFYPIHSVLLYSRGQSRVHSIEVTLTKIHFELSNLKLINSKWIQTIAHKKLIIA